MAVTKHPIWGYLTEEEAKKAMEGTHAERDHWMKKAREREEQAKKRGRKR